MTDSAEHPWPEALTLAERMAADTAGTMRAVLLYGSRLHKTSPDLHSALDFVVIVDDYRRFYDGLKAAGQMPRPVGVMTTLARVLAPNVIAYVPEDGAVGIAKCLVITQADLERALGPRPPDHFVLGRLIQRIGFVWTAEDVDRTWVESVVAGAHARVLDWMEPYMEGPFTAGDLGLRLLEVCYRGEFRPESKGRAERIYEAQAHHLTRALQPGLTAAVESGRLEMRADGRYALPDPTTAAVRRRWAWHFRRSKARTTLRWFKHMVTFANWLPYIVRKVERHTGRTIELTTLERKLPLLFLWPRAIHVLVTRPKRELKP